MMTRRALPLCMLFLPTCLISSKPCGCDNVLLTRTRDCRLVPVRLGLPPPLVRCSVAPGFDLFSNSRSCPLLVASWVCSHLCLSFRAGRYSLLFQTSRIGSLGRVSNRFLDRKEYIPVVGIIGS